MEKLSTEYPKFTRFERNMLAEFDVGNSIKFPLDVCIIPHIKYVR